MRQEGRRARSRWLVGGVGTLAMVAVFAACALDLEPPLGPVGADASPDVDAAPVDDGSSDGSSDAGDAAPPPECTDDRDCPAVNPCLTPRCDKKRQRCAYDLCPTGSACTFRHCESAPTACAAAVEPLSFLTTTLTVPGTIACDVPSRCVALAYPFLYAVVDGKTVAIDVSRLETTAPKIVPLEGIDFAPVNVVASGRYVYFVGRPFLAASPGIRLGWLDAPRHAFVDELVAATTPSSFPDPSPSSYRALPAPNDGLYLGVVLANNATHYYAYVQPPVGAANAFVILPPTAGGAAAPRVPVASSGERVLVSAGAGDQFFFVRRPGADNAASSAVTLRPNAQAPHPNHSAFTQDEDGRILWTAGLVNAAGNVDRVRLSWMVDGTQSGLDGGLPGVDLAVFDGGAPPDTVAAAPGALIEGAAAVGLARSAGGGTSVQLVHRDGGVATKVIGRSVVLPEDPSTILAAFSARGLVYVVHQAPAVDPDPAFLAIHVLAPECEP